ncbi:aldehyde dehydrogenase family protein [Paraburkholderia sabiae]|uniref:Aldehyde dehydrogenase family protein n=1 Tax=Paraburkholderia sabiae TaxID=273251 RepID=A0ABU9QHW5_9BURK|nr:aldehyde dehydrogenase family protein [Paraburkholderia sabiae]WJZ77426.1 aldehyde dehydrogenase family protein [Paraburkholderia sabiae]CAD6557776.1 Putative aldehyde dehydrogenase AldA [Paraburkholderia sabiae]
MTRSYGHFIANQFTNADSPNFITRVSPVNGEAVARFAEGSTSDIDAAVRAARQAFDTGPWPKMDAGARAALLHKWSAKIAENREKLARIEVEEVGKPIRYARADMDTVCALIDYAAGLGMHSHGLAYSSIGPNRTGVVLREPVGVVGVIVPWNFPAETFAKKVPFALAAGCTCVVKPSEFTSGTALELARLAAEVGIPEGVVNVVTGYGHAVGNALSGHNGVDLVSFTGSTRVGKQIIASAGEHTARAAVELGGKGATIVFDDADISDAVSGALMSISFNQGECCVAGSRLLVHSSIADTFLKKLVEAMAGLRIGDPFDESTDIGSMIHGDHFRSVIGHIETAQKEGAAVLCGGLSGTKEDGLLITPTVLDGVSPSMSVFRQEVFGPVLAVTRFDSIEEAIALANDTEYGLANSVWSKNIDTVMTVAKALRSGIVWANTALDGALQLPFGGNGKSGFGRELGEAGLEEFTSLKSILIHTGKRTTGFGVAPAVSE